jgi:hypothetical protein
MKTVKYLCNLLGISATDNEIVIQDMLLELASLRDSFAFVLFAKKEFESRQYLNGYQKFLSLINEYKNIENEAYFWEINKKAIREKEKKTADLVEKIGKYRLDILGKYARSEKINPLDYLTEEEIDILPFNIADSVVTLDDTYDRIVRRFVDDLHLKFTAEIKPKEITFNSQNKALDIARKALR